MCGAVGFFIFNFAFCILHFRLRISAAGGLWLMDQRIFLWRAESVGWCQARAARRWAMAAAQAKRMATMRKISSNSVSIRDGTSIAGFSASQMS